MSEEFKKQASKVLRAHILELFKRYEGADEILKEFLDPEDIRKVKFQMLDEICQKKKELEELEEISH